MAKDRYQKGIEKLKELTYQTVTTQLAIWILVRDIKMLRLI